MFSLIGLGSLHTAAWAQPHEVTIHADDQGFKLQVDGADTMLYGMNWDYYPVGENYRYDFWSLPDDKIEEALRTEMSLLRRMGVNTIRQYPVIPPRWVEWIHDNYGIYTMINPLVGRYGVTVNGTYIAKTDYADPAIRAQLVQETLDAVRPYRNTRGVILFLLGNEANYGLEWDSFETANMPTEERNRAKARYLYSLYGEIVDKIHEVDDDHLVAICNGDLGYLDLIRELVPNQDLFGANVYRGRTSRDLFQRVKDELGIPFFYSEFGADAFDAAAGREDGATQAAYLRDQWIEIFEHSHGRGTGVAVGGYVFQWSDGWWKYGQESNLEVHDPTASWANGAYPEDFVEGQNNMNEEWFGITAKLPPGNDGLFEVQPREAYYLLQDLFARVDPYDPDTTDADLQELRQLSPEAYRDQVEVARIASGGAQQRVRISDFRVELGTITSGGSARSGRGALETTSDHLQSIYLGAEARPDESLRFDATVNVLGNVPDNFIDPIRYETRGRAGSPVLLTEDGAVDLGALDRVQIYRASYDWSTPLFEMKGYYRTGSYHWAYEGDFFGLYPETNYGPFLDQYNGNAPIKVEVEGKRALSGWTVAAGPQVFWGANPSVFVKYDTSLGGPWGLTVVHQEDIAPFPAAAVAQSQAVPEQLTRKTTLRVGYGRWGDALKVDVGGIWAGTPKIGQEFVEVVDADGGGPSYVDRGYHVLRDQIRLVDTFGGKARVTGRVANGRVEGFVQGSRQGLVADGGWENWRPGARLSASGRGNHTAAWAGTNLNLGSIMLGASGLYQQPLVGPNPGDPGVLDPELSVYYPAVPARNFIEDPFAVLENRETLAGEVVLKFDPTPATYFYQWDNELREDAVFAMDVALVFQHLPTVRDSQFGFLADGTLFAFGGSPPPADLWAVDARMVSNLGEVQLHLKPYVGTGQARGTDPRLVTRKGMDFRAYWRTLRVDGFVRLDDWGPYDFHRDFNLTFPLQTFLDVSGGLARPKLVGTSTRFGVSAKFRLLDEFSPPPAVVGGVAQEALAPDAPFQSEIEIGTYVRLSL